MAIVKLVRTIAIIVLQKNVSVVNLLTISTSPNVFLPVHPTPINHMTALFNPVLSAILHAGIAIHKINVFLVSKGIICLKIHVWKVVLLNIFQLELSVNHANLLVRPVYLNLIAQAVRLAYCLLMENAWQIVH